MSRSLPSPERLRELLSYDPDTGILRWRVALGGRAKPGNVAGWIQPDGYRQIQIAGFRVYSGPVIWAMMTGAWPIGEIDHCETHGPKADFGDRWENLREVTHTQNAWNSRPNSKNRTGCRGVAWFPLRSKWRARIECNGRAVHLGLFNTLEEAVCARRAAEAQLYQEFRPQSAL